MRCHCLPLEGTGDQRGVSSFYRSSLTNFRDVDGADLDVLEKLIRFELAGAGVLAVGPQRCRAAVGVADAEVVEIDGERAGSAAGEDDAVLAQRTGRGAGEADDAMLPGALAVGDAGAGDSDRGRTDPRRCRA